MDGWDVWLFGEAAVIIRSSWNNGTFPGPMIVSCNVLKCLNKFDFTLKPLLQRPHMKGRSPVIEYKI